MRILIVDDCPDNRLPLANLLRGAGYTDLVLAETATEALNLLSPEGPAGAAGAIDVVLMDVIMPGMDGIEACRRIKAHDRLRDIPVLMVTGRTGPEDLQDAFAAGAMDYITKPVNAVELLARLRSALALKREMDCRKGREEDLVQLTQKLEEANQALERLSLLDGLTGIANRRYLESFLNRESMRAARSFTPLALILVDIDFFKNYNDTYGHQRGDDCLKQVVHALTRVLHRPGDLLARYGGEEFLAILPDTDLEGASVVAKALRLAVEELGIEHSTSPMHDRVTVSIGVAAAVPSTAISPEGLIAAADAALYGAKRDGRNCVRHAAHRDRPESPAGPASEATKRDAAGEREASEKADLQQLQAH